MLILTEGRTDPYDAKAAVGLIRYRGDEVVGLLDSQFAGRDVGKVLGVGAGLPVVADVASARSLDPQTFVIGIAPRGGALPSEWRRHILDALEAGLDVVSGLHDFLGEDAEFAAAAERNWRRIYDVRRPPEHVPIGTNRAAELAGTRVLTVGTDCNIGKMHASLELAVELAQRGRDVDFVATGQIGIMISGRGVPVDHVLSDFVSGAVEQELMEHGGHELSLVEGQGALTHPGFSAVTLGIMHGSAPDAMVLCHNPCRTVQRGGGAVPPLPELISLHEAACRHVYPSQVVAVSLNCAELDEAAAREAVECTAGETALPTTDPVRFGAGPLADAVEMML
jgi:uncharacterized NAD-dependent epimerase/dehydratase family protein